MRLEGKKLVSTEAGSEQVVNRVTVVPILGGSGSRTVPVGVEHGNIPIEREAFDVGYECRNCGHKWTESISQVEENR